MEAEGTPAEFEEAVAEAVSREVFSNYRVSASVPWLAEKAQPHPGPQPPPQPPLQAPPLLRPPLQALCPALPAPPRPNLLAAGPLRQATLPSQPRCPPCRCRPPTTRWWRRCRPRREGLVCLGVGGWWWLGGGMFPPQALALPVRPAPHGQGPLAAQAAH